MDGWVWIVFIDRSDACGREMNGWSDVCVYGWMECVCVNLCVMKG